MSAHLALGYSHTFRRLGAECIAVSNTALRVFGSTSWTGTSATEGADVDRIVIVSNHDLSNGVFVKAADASTGANALVTSTDGIYLGPGAIYAFPVQKGHDLFVVRAAGTGRVYAEVWV